MYPCPEHFIIRPGHSGRGESIVPLIAVDQIPDWIQLTGVPRNLDPEQAVALINLGLIAGDGASTYEVCLRTDMIRAIMCDNVEEKEAESLTSSGFVGEKGKEMEEEKVQKAPASRPQEEADTTKTGNNQVKALENPQEQGDTMIKAAEKAPKIDSTSPSQEARAWSDESESACPRIISSVDTKDQPIPPNEKHKHVDKTDKKKRQPTPEPTLSASRHNTTAGAAQHKPARKDKPIRPHLMEERRDPQPRRVVVVSRTKDKFFGTKPDTLYCRHWCHHGTCKWGWECRYQHRMPTNQEGLREVGLTDFPMWYLLMMAAGGFPGTEGHGGTTLNADAMRSVHHPMTNDNILDLSHLSRAPHPADALLHRSSPIEHRLMQGRMAALLVGSTSMSNRQRLQRMNQMRDAALQSNALKHSNYASVLGLATSYSHHGQGRANLHTNASLAANAADLSAANRRQALREAERRADAPVEIRDGVKDEEGKGRDVGSYGELKGRLSSVCSDEEEGEDSRNFTVREGKLVDIE